MPGQPLTVGAPEAFVTDQELPTTLDRGRYRIEKVLGSGGTATVLLAEDTRIGVRRAIKILHPQYARSAESRRRFLNEAHAQAGLAHPNVLMVHDAVEDEVHAFLVMELAEGGNLGDRVVLQGVLSPVDVAEVGITIGSALGVAHRAGVIHRDIKPANILVDRHGVLKLADFGIARVDGERFHLTQTGSVMGTWAYMPPEQRSDSASVDARSDIYAFGVTLYALLKGREASDLHNREAWERAFVGVPPGLAEIIQTATRLFPEDRYATADELVEALRTWLAQEAGGAHVRSRPSATFLPDSPTNLTLDGAGDHETAQYTLIPTPATTFDGLSEDSSGPMEVAPTVLASPEDIASGAFPTGAAAGDTQDSAPTTVPGASGSNTLMNLLVGVMAAASVVAVCALLWVLFVAKDRGKDGVLPPAVPPTVTVAPQVTPPPVEPPPTGPDPVPPVDPDPVPTAEADAGKTPGGTASPETSPPEPKGSSGRRRRVIKVIPSGSADDGGTADPPPDAGPAMGKLRVRTVPSGATVKLRGRTLPSSGGVVELPIGNQTVELVSASGESTRIAVMVKESRTVELCYSFDTNSACGAAQ